MSPDMLEIVSRSHRATSAMRPRACDYAPEEKMSKKRTRQIKILAKA